jgi:uncharacterized protein YbjT (DUF2867 family)
LDGACDGIDVVLSCLGASVVPSLAKGRRSYARVDTPANVNLIEAARAAGVKRFVYVSVANHDALGHLEYVSAHERVVTALAASGIDHVVIRPTGFFSAFAELLPMARRGPIPVIGDGSARTNPIHDATLATVCVDAVDGGAREIVVGGPEILTRRQIVEEAFHAVGKRPRVLPMPPLLMRSMALLMRPANPRMGRLMEFVTAVSTRDVVAPRHGTHRLPDYFAERARAAGR